MGDRRKKHAAAHYRNLANSAGKKRGCLKMGIFLVLMSGAGGTLIVQKIFG